MKILISLFTFTILVFANVNNTHLKGSLIASGTFQEDGFLNSYKGDKVKAYRDIQKRVDKYVKDNKFKGNSDKPMNFSANINGFNMTVRIVVLDGKGRISTAFIR